MAKHIDYIMTADLRDAYMYLLRQGKRDPNFDVFETGPSPKRSVRYKYAGRSSNPFSFIVNSGERKDYHLFYIRKPRAGDKIKATGRFLQGAVNENPRGEITIRIRNRQEAEKVWGLVDEIRLQ